jgi:hypothetical protein
MSTDSIIIERYLMDWGRFMRVDRGCKTYSGLDWGDIVGENPVTLEDPMLDRMCAAMRFLKGSKPITYSVLYVLYVDQESVKAAPGKLGLSRRRVSDYKQDGVIFLAGYLLGRAHEQESSGGVQRWGEYAEGPIEPPKSMRSA